MSVLMKDVAERAGVSVTTVSHVINDTRDIAPATRERVLGAIAKLNYYKNNSARLLVRGHSDTVGLIISDIENPFVPELVKSFERAASEKGLEILLGMTNYEPKKAEAAVRRMIEARVLGVAVMTSQLDSRLVDRLFQAGLPAVLLDAHRTGRLRGEIVLDYSAGIATAVEHAYRLGHRDAAILHGPLTVTSASRYHALLHEAVAECGMRLTGTLEAKADPESGARGAQILLGIKRPPTVVFCGNDLLAIGALGQASRMGFCVPADVSIIGCDDIAMASYTQPPLSTIRIPRDTVGQQAFDLLESMFRSKTQSAVRSKARRGSEAVITTSFVARASSGPASRHRTVSGKAQGMQLVAGSTAGKGNR